jgi:hypothetical protein
MPTLRLQPPAAVELDASTWRLWLEGEPEEGLAMRVRVDPNAPIAWRELDKLKELVELEYQGTDARVATYVATNKKLRTFRWLRHAKVRIDLARSTLTELSVDARSALTLHLPRSLTTLRLLDVTAWNRLAVRTDDGGARLAVWIWGPAKPVRAIAGLPRLRVLSVGAAKELDLALVAKHPHLERLEVFGDENGIAIANVRRLASLPGLAEIQIRSAFHTDFSRFPSPDEMPALQRLEIDGVRTDAAAMLKERFRGFSGLSLRGVRSDAWLRANADNPFREWSDEYGAALGRRATKAYRDAHASFDASRPTARQAEAVLRRFVEAFNEVEAQIDTIMREEIDGAFQRLAERVRGRVPDATATRWFDAWRDF